MRQITINAALNGLIVNVGCQTLVFGTAEEMLRELKGYIENPQMTERRYMRQFAKGDEKRAEEVSRKMSEQCANASNRAHSAAAAIGYSGGDCVVDVPVGGAPTTRY